MFVIMKFNLRTKVRLMDGIQKDKGNITLCPSKQGLTWSLQLQLGLKIQHFRIGKYGFCYRTNFPRNKIMGYNFTSII